MSSIIRVDEIKNSSGNTVLNNGYPTQPGQVIEYLSSQCDGSQLTGLANTFTWQNVTSSQDFSTTYLDVTGSTISYTPPPGTSRVIYQFTFGYAWQSTAHAIQHMKFFIDDNEVIQARHNRSSTYYESRYTFEWIIPIGGVQNNNTGRQATWTSNKSLKMQARRYAAASNGGLVHGTVYWDGAGSNQFNIPTLTLIAIA
jgi:uncharacterized lipoprotein